MKRHTDHEIDPAAPISAKQLGDIMYAESRQLGPYKVIADRVGITVQAFCSMVNHHRLISDRVARAFGYRRVYMYERIEP